MSDVDMRFQLALRIGVTGARRIAPEQIPALRLRIDDMLRLVRADVARLAEDGLAKAVYRQDPPAFSLVSPLAEGADRLVAEVAVGLGFGLVAPLPFTQSDYETDFPETVETFRHLLGGAQVVELDGGRGAAEAPSYEAVGRFVVRNCDLLIAIWDGKPAQGQGGTGDIVRFAMRSDVPVWWIDIESTVPRFITSAKQLQTLDVADATKPEDALANYLSGILLPPVVGHPERHGIVGHAVHRYCLAVEFDPHPLRRFLDEPAPTPSRGLWRAFDRFYFVIAPPDDRMGPPTPNHDIKGYWAARYQRADGLSVTYGDKYRSSYVLIIVLALTAFCLSVVGSIFHSGAIGVGLELVALLCIGALVWQNHLQGWQERWIAYRLLAELCRKQVMLSHLGHTFSWADAHAVIAEPFAEADAATLPREAWVSWDYAASVRAAPLPPRSADLAKRNALEIARYLVAEQKTYHGLRALRADTADRRLIRYGEIFFVLTVVGLIVVFGFLVTTGHFGPGKGIEIAATMFSGVSAAFVGLRAYAEFALLAQESRRMEKIMRDTAIELDGFDLEAPLASRELGVSLQRLAGLMMQDVRGWAQLFRLKTVEAG